MHHNREIVKGVLAQFLELGASASGSRALSSDQTDLFLQSLESVAKGVASVFNRHAIPQLVDLNFENVTEYPKLDFKNISRQKVGEIATAYKTFVDSNALVSTEQDEQHIREMLGLPAREDDDAREDVVDDEQEDETEEVADELGMSEKADEIKKKIYPTRREVEKAVQHQLSHSNNITLYLKQMIARCSDKYEHEHFYKTIRSVCGGLLADIDRAEFAEENDFTPENKDFNRPMTFAEEKVDFKSIKKQMDRLEGSLSKESKKILNKEKDRFMKEFSRAVNKGDVVAMKKAQMKAKTAYAVVIKEHIKKAFEFGKNNASREMGKKVPANPKEMLKQIDFASTTIAEQQLAETTHKAKLAYNESASKGKSVPASLAVAEAKMVEKIKKLADNTASITVTGFINNGRNTVFKAYSDDIYALQRSELLDSATCNFCLSIDGRIVEKDDDFADNGIFHSGCRGIWVEILKDEKDKPDIAGIPDSLRDRFGDAVNDLIQPKTPTNTGKNSEAKKEIKKRRDNRIKKQNKKK